MCVCRLLHLQSGVGWLPIAQCGAQMAKARCQLGERHGAGSDRSGQRLLAHAAAQSFNQIRCKTRSSTYRRQVVLRAKRIGDSWRFARRSTTTYAGSMLSVSPFFFSNTMTPVIIPFPYSDLNGASAVGPSIVGSDIYGQAALWADFSTSPAQVTSAYLAPGSTTWTSPTTIGSGSGTSFVAATTFSSPANAVAWDWPGVDLTGGGICAWVDSEDNGSGSFNLYISTDAGQSTVVYATIGTNSNPVSMAYGNNLLYLGWLDNDSSGNTWFYCGTYDQYGNINYAQTSVQITADTAGPTLTWYEGTLYALFGGSFGVGGGSGSALMQVYFSTDQGQTFDQLSLADGVTTLYPPTMAVQDGLYAIVFADDNLDLNVITTTDLSSDLSNLITYNVGCHGSIAVAITMGQLAVCWPIVTNGGTPPTHEVLAGTIPITLPTAS